MITKAAIEQVYKLVQRYIPVPLFSPNEYERMAAEPLEEHGDVNKTQGKIPYYLFNYYKGMIESSEIDNELKNYLNKAVDAIVRPCVYADFKWSRERGIEIIEDEEDNRYD